MFLLILNAFYNQCLLSLSTLKKMHGPSLPREHFNKKAMKKEITSREKTAASSLIHGKCHSRASEDGNGG